MGINNPHHYTDYSRACAYEYGVGCDGSIENSALACDCPCHTTTETFEQDDDVAYFHGWEDESYTDSGWNDTWYDNMNTSGSIGFSVFSE